MCATVQRVRYRPTGGNRHRANDLLLICWYAWASILLWWTYCVINLRRDYTDRRSSGNGMQHPTGNAQLQSYGFCLQMIKPRRPGLF